MMIRILAFLLVFPSLLWAQTMPQPLSDTVSDFADLLTPDQESVLAKTLQAGRNSTGVHVTVVTMGSINDYGGQGQSIETYAKNLFNLWGVGDAKRDDGILMLVAKDDRAMRIALGDGFEAVYDGLAQRVIDRDMLPAFRDGRYAAGIQTGTEAVIEQLARPFGNHQTPAAKRDYSGLSTALIYLVVGGAVAAAVFWRNVGDLITAWRACPNCGNRGLWRERMVQRAASRLMAGSGLQTTRCRHCDYLYENTYTIPRIGRRSSSSGGFGGGHSSGGGASGRW